VVKNSLENDSTFVLDK